MASLPSTRHGFRKLVATTLTTDFRAACKVVDASIPSIGDDEVLLRNRFVGINATDINVAAGRYSPGKEPPLSVGLEGIGIAEEVGKKVPLAAVGKPYGYIHNGAFSEYLTVPYRTLLPVSRPHPEFVPFLISGLTAEISIDQYGGLQQGNVALITAAAGGTGHLAVQIAKQRGCHVIALCSSKEKAEFLTSLGADRVVNSSEEDLAHVLAQEYKQGINLAYESIGGKVFQTCVDSLAVKGRIISLGYISSYTAPSGVDRGAKNATLIQKLLTKSATVSGFFLFNHRKDYRTYFQRLLTMYDNGELCPHFEQGNASIEKFTGLESICDAVDYLYSRKSMGKIVVDLQPTTDSKL